jgi:hypothetical protein
MMQEITSPREQKTIQKLIMILLFTCNHYLRNIKDVTWPLKVSNETLFMSPKKI